MKKTQIGIPVLIIFLFLCQPSFSQFMRSGKPAGHRGRNPVGRSMFLFKTFNFADTTDFSKSRMQFHISLVNDILTFVKESDNRYRASYEINVVFYNEQKEPIAEKSDTRKIIVHTFEETNLRTNPWYHQFDISLPPGEYQYEIQLYDFESDHALVRRNKIKLRDFQRNRIHLSDLIFADQINCDDVSQGLKPNLSKLFVDRRSAMAAVWEIYPPVQTDSLTLIYSLYDSRGGRVFGQTELLGAAKKAIIKCISLKEHIKRPGDYYLLVKAQAGKQVATERQKFTVQWRTLPSQQQDLDLAIRQLALIVKARELSAMKKASGAEKKRLYDEFWEKRDPTPGTPENELKDEFFRRVDFANRNFAEPSVGLDGWETDRGRVYIQNGPPDAIEKEPVEINMPTAEIWYYARLDKRYIFSDRDGSGHYRLVRVE